MHQLNLFLYLPKHRPHEEKPEVAEPITTPLPPRLDHPQQSRVREFRSIALQIERHKRWKECTLRTINVLRQGTRESQGSEETVRDWIVLVIAERKTEMKMSDLGQRRQNIDEFGFRNRKISQVEGGKGGGNTTEEGRKKMTVMPKRGSAVQPGNIERSKSRHRDMIEEC
jgi:hypothetical protein